MEFGDSAFILTYFKVVIEPKHAASIENRKGENSRGLLYYTAQRFSAWAVRKGFPQEPRKFPLPQLYHAHQITPAVLTGWRILRRFCYTAQTESTPISAWNTEQRRCAYTPHPCGSGRGEVKLDKRGGKWRWSPGWRWGWWIQKLSKTLIVYKW